MEQTLEVTISVDRAGMRRQKIIASARRLFLIKGFHSTGVAQIAKESGVAVGQIYRDFACKEDIIAAIVKGDCADFLEAESLQQNIYSGRIDLIWSWVHDFLSPPDADSDMLLSEILAEAGRNERVADIFRTMHRDVQVAMHRALEALAPGQHLAERRAQLADMVVAMSLGFSQQRFMQSREATARACQLALKMAQDEVASMQQLCDPADIDA
jgi:AcrR family transcriptional regulator